MGNVRQDPDLYPDVWQTPEAAAFLSGLRLFGNWLDMVGARFVGLFGRMFTKGWRPYVCVVGGTILGLAWYQAFYQLPAVGKYPPEMYYIQLQIFSGLILAMMGLRTVDKAVERHQQNQQAAAWNGGLVNPSHPDEANGKP